MARFEFTKMHGISNDYVYVDCFRQSLNGVDVPALSRRISDRHRGIGSDGLILITPPSKDVVADARMEMYNADGSRGKMCGNGVRCVAKYAVDHGLADAKDDKLRVETDRGVLTLVVLRGPDGRVERVRVDMGPPILEAADIPVEFPRHHAGPIVRYPLGRYIPLGQPAAWMEDCGFEPFMTCVSMGNPHMVVYCGNVAGVPLQTLGPFFERQNIFPERINVHFATAQSRTEVTMRTWERGSGVTQACGTGACAVHVAGVLEERLDRSTTVHLPGGDLSLEWPRGAESSVFMTGPAEEVFQGVWEE